MIDYHYTNLKLAEIYDADSGWSVDRDFYLALAQIRSQNLGRALDILDIGCGTGLLCNAYAAAGHRVMGCDPSEGMLSIARKKPLAGSIEWVQEYAQNLSQQRLFDLIIMTGHAFQVLMDEADVLATCRTMKRHLQNGGMIVFESRNPAIDWSARWNYDITLAVPSGTVKESRRFISLAGNVMSFELVYEFADEVLKSPSTLRFWSREEITICLNTAGLLVEDIYGDWDGSAFRPDTSLEMIFLISAE